MESRFYKYQEVLLSDGYLVKVELNLKFLFVDTGATSLTPTSTFQRST